jgi:hypothetical protein
MRKSTVAAEVPSWRWVPTGVSVMLVRSEVTT